MPNTNPKISVGMPVYNCCQTVETAIHSILNQTFGDLELIIIDDGSNDGTPLKVSKFTDQRIQFIRGEENQGLPARLNQALKLSRGAFFARMDGDDVSYPQRIQRQLEFLEAHQEVDLVGSGILVFKENGIPIGKRQGPENHDDICKNPPAGFPIAHPTYFGRHTWFQRYQYRIGAIRTEDQDLLLRSFLDSRFANLSEILLGYRESQLDLKGILKGRYYYSKSVWEELIIRRKQIFAISGLFIHLFKGLLDLIAIGSGLNHWLLRQRAKSISIAERQIWNKVWRSTQT